MYREKKANISKKMPIHLGINMFYHKARNMSQQKVFERNQMAKKEKKKNPIVSYITIRKFTQ